MSNDNKQFLAVVVFILFLIVSIAGLAITSSKENSTKESEIVSNKKDDINTEIVIPDIQEVEGTTPVKVITSNKNVTSNKTVNSNKVVTSNKTVTSNTKVSNKNVSNKSNKKTIPVDYFITELDKNKIYVGGVANISVTIKPDNATNKKVTYNSTDSSVARVSKTGTIIGISPGTCYIDIDVDGGGTCRVKITVLKKPTTSTSNSNVIETIISNVNSNTNIISNKNSNVTSNTTSNKNSNTKSNTTSNKTSNTIVNATSVSISRTSISLSKGSSTRLSATVIPTNATNKTVTWSSSNPAVATVDQYGNVTAKDAGKVVVTVKTANGKIANCVVVIDGWTNNKKSYYKNGNKLTNAYQDYVYLDANGNAMAKVGTFSITMYGARAWAERNINIRAGAATSTALVSTIPEGGKMTIIGEESNGYIKIKYGSYTGYVWTAYIMINLPDVIPGITYNITNGYSSIFKTSGYSIPNITNKNLYGYSKQYNPKTGQNTYYAPLLYPVAKKLQNAYNSATKAGYSFIIYDTYRPADVGAVVDTEFRKLANSNATVANGINYDRQGYWWGVGWFMSPNGKSNHSRGIAIDLALADSKGRELNAQTNMHELDTRALRKYNNGVANTLSGFMTGAGFGVLNSEWWHFEDVTYNGNAFHSFKIS